MRLELFNYRFAEEVLSAPSHRPVWDELMEVCGTVPVFIRPGKSKTNANLDVVQQLMNTFFDRRLSIDNDWEYQPAATKIPDSNLTADFRKTINDLSIQIEVQFGNMSRWYSDIFKFQAAYAQSLAKLAVSIVPMSERARRIDSNIVNFERTVRELPSADLSITLPILVIGLGFDDETKIVDVSRTQFSIGEITGRGHADNRWRIVNAYLNGVPMEEVGPESQTGPTVRDRDGENEG